MNTLSKKKIVLLGMMSRWPVAGVAWVTAQYLVGLERLGYEVYYVETHGCSPAMLLENRQDDSSAKAADYIAKIMHRFDLGDRWAYHAPQERGRCFGLSDTQLSRLYQSAALIINLHGATEPLPENIEADRLLYLETDPVHVEMKLHHGDPAAKSFLQAHGAFFTWGLNYGNPDCAVPLPTEFPFKPTRPPVVADLWQANGEQVGPAYTTIGSYRQPGRDIHFRGEVYHWSKHREFIKFIDLPQRRSLQPFELALNRCREADKAMLERNGWQVRDALGFSTDLDSYRDYITRSRGEFTVAKDQNIRLKSGWFSERSAQYLAAARPVITQETGFSNVLPTGHGLFAFSTMEEIIAALDEIDSDYDQHSQAARTLAREYFNYDVVLKPMLADVGL